MFLTGGRGSGSGVGQPNVLGAIYYNTYSSGDMKFVKQKQIDSAGEMVRRVYKSNIYIAISRADVIMSISYWDGRKQTWRTIDAKHPSDWTERESEMVARAQRLWLAELRRRRKR